MCYWGRSNYTLHWYEVEQACGTVYAGAEMVTIHDLDLNTFIAEHIAVNPNGTRQHAWLGLHRTDSSSDWKWKDGSEVNFTEWYMNDDDYVGGDCAAINAWEWGMWAGWFCINELRFFMCQIAAQGE